MAEDAETAILVANPRCLAARGHTAASVRELLRTAGLALAPMSLEPDIPPAELRHRAHAVGATTVVAAGGDGTLHLVANALAGTRLRLAVLPMGTANDFARALGIPSNLTAAAALAARGHGRPIDLGRVNGRYFLNAAHLGLGAEAARHANERLKRWLGPLAYVLAALGAWRDAAPLDLALRADGQTAVMKASQVLIANGRYFGGGNLAGHDATLEDGLLDVQLLAPSLPARALPRLAGALRHGDLGGQPEAIAFRTTRLDVVLGHDEPVNLDGEILALGQRLRFEVMPGEITVIAPARVTVSRSATDATAPGGAR